MAKARKNKKPVLVTPNYRSIASTIDKLELPFEEELRKHATTLDDWLKISKAMMEAQLKISRLVASLLPK